MATSYDNYIVIGQTNGFNGGFHGHDLENRVLMAMTFHKCFSVMFWYVFYHLSSLDP